MRVGAFNHLITLQRQAETGEIDDLDQPIKAWSTIAKFWVEKIHKTEDEAFSASQRYASRTVTFRAHFRSDVTETDRLLVDGLAYNVLGVREVGFREVIEISAEWRQ